MTAAEEAKQLDSVTDMVQEKELDATKAQEAMSSLSKNTKKDEIGAASKIAVSKEDVALIVSEMEVTEDVAERALRDVADQVEPGQSLLAAALRKLVTS